MQCFIGPCRLLIRGRKSKGPKTDSCGTPHAMLEVLDTKALLQIAYGLLNMIQTICLSIHIFHSSQLAQQNAMIPSIKSLLKVNKIPHAKLPLSRALNITSATFNRAYKVE